MFERRCRYRVKLSGVNRLMKKMHQVPSADNLRHGLNFSALGASSSSRVQDHSLDKPIEG